MEIDEDLLFSPSILRLWRTGADKYIYSSSEDGDCDVGSTKHHGPFSLWIAKVSLAC